MNSIDPRLDYLGIETTVLTLKVPQKSLFSSNDLRLWSVAIEMSILYCSPKISFSSTINVNPLLSIYFKVSRVEDCGAFGIPN